MARFIRKLVTSGICGICGVILVDVVILWHPSIVRAAVDQDLIKAKIEAQVELRRQQRINQVSTSEVQVEEKAGVEATVSKPIHSESEVSDQAVKVEVVKSWWGGKVRIIKIGHQWYLSLKWG